MHPAELIQRKRDGAELSAGDLRELILGYARGDVPDYQLAAFCMAVFFRGLTSEETFALTEAMIGSGEILELGKALGRDRLDTVAAGAWSTSTRPEESVTRRRSSSGRSSRRAAFPSAR